MEHVINHPDSFSTLDQIDDIIRRNDQRKKGYVIIDNVINQALNGDDLFKRKITKCIDDKAYEWMQIATYKFATSSAGFRVPKPRIMDNKDLYELRDLMQLQLKNGLSTRNELIRSGKLVENYDAFDFMNNSILQLWFQKSNMDQIQHKILDRITNQLQTIQYCLTCHYGIFSAKIQAAEFGRREYRQLLMNRIGNQYDPSNPFTLPRGGDHNIRFDFQNWYYAHKYNADKLQEERISLYKKRGDILYFRQFQHISELFYMALAIIFFQSSLIDDLLMLNLRMQDIVNVRYPNAKDKDFEFMCASVRGQTADTYKTTKNRWSIWCQNQLEMMVYCQEFILHRCTMDELKADYCSVLMNLYTSSTFFTDNMREMFQVCQNFVAQLRSGLIAYTGSPVQIWKIIMSYMADFMSNKWEVKYDSHEFTDYKFD